MRYQVGAMMGAWLAAVSPPGTDQHWPAPSCLSIPTFDAQGFLPLQLVLLLAPTAPLAPHSTSVCSLACLYL